MLVERDIRMDESRPQFAQFRKLWPRLLETLHHVYFSASRVFLLQMESSCPHIALFSPVPSPLPQTRPPPRLPP